MYYSGASGKILSSLTKKHDDGLLDNDIESWKS